MILGIHDTRPVHVFLFHQIIFLFLGYIQSNGLYNSHGIKMGAKEFKGVTYNHGYLEVLK